MGCLKRRPSARSGIGLGGFNCHPLGFRQFQGGARAAPFKALLGTYVRLKGMGILPVFACDGDFRAAFHYHRPESLRTQRELLRQ